MRWRLDVSYDGTDFHGWAEQPGLRTVQETVTAAVVRVVPMLRGPDAGPAPVLTCAGRTDAGVHATGQVAHLDLAEAAIDAPDRFVRRLNAVLPDDVVVTAASTVPADFDARFAALWRRYTYRICDTPSALDPLQRQRTWLLNRLDALDAGVMDAAARRLVGEHDFAAFCKQREGASTTREVLDFGWTRDESGVLIGTVRADAFCHSMVRSLVGAMVAVGTGRREVAWPYEVLVEGRRDAGVQVAPARGLTLVEVGYPDEAGLAARAAVTRQVRE